ncbi:phage portal protein [Rothia nasimurium]|nr:phage portal protein [Rothia nasimurium]
MELFKPRKGAVAAATHGVPFAPLPVQAPAIASPFSDSSVLAGIHAEHLRIARENAPIDRAAAMSLAPVAKARNIMAGTIARFPLAILAGNSPYADAPAWATQIERYRPSYQTMVWTVDALIFYGRAFWLVTDRYASGTPRYFQWVPEWKASVTDEGLLTEAFGKKVNPQDYIRIDAHHEGFLSFGSRLLRKSLATERAAENAAENPVPSIELHQLDGDDLTTEERQALIQEWRNARTSAGGGVAFTNAALEVRTHGIAAENLLIDAQNQAAVAVARALGVPAWAVDANVTGTSLSYSNSHTRARELIDFGLRPYMDAITARLSMDDVLAHGVWCKFDTREIIQPPFKERMEAYKVAIEAGLYTAEDCRALEEGTPLEKKENTDG